jgi:hypothetical protein
VPTTWKPSGVKSGLRLQPPVSAGQLAAAWADSVQGLCHGARLDLDEDGPAEVRGWVGGGLAGVGAAT